MGVGKMADQLSQAQQNEYKDVFNHFDTTKSGQLDKKQFQMLMLSMGEETDIGSIMHGNTIDFNTFLQNRQDKWAREQSGEEADQMVRDAGGGQINYTNFVEKMKRKT